MAALSDLVDRLIVRIGELDALEVGLHTSGIAALGQHDVAAAQTPGNQNLGQGVAALGREVVQSLVLADTLASSGDLVLRTERRVGLRHDALGQAVVDQLGVGQEGVDLDLIDMRGDLGERQELLSALNGPVGHTDCAGLAVLVELLHRAPGRFGVLGQVLEDHVLLQAG